MNSLYVDSLTGIPNLFGLMELNLEEAFGSSGTFLFLDSKHLHRVNTEFSRELGDQYLRTLGAILDELAFAHHPEILGFRAGGDLFILRFPPHLEEKAASIGMETNRELHRRMAAYGVHFGGAHVAVWTYSALIQSVAELMKQSMLHLMRTIVPDEEEVALPRWADHIINDLFLRVRDTLSLLEVSHALAHQDDVSGLPNHRSARLELSRVETAFEQDGHSYAVLFIDGDNLKRYNDLGYEHGNRMIHGIADILKASLREEDRVYRWLSGDEFLVILPHAEPAKALEIAERLRARLETDTKEWVYPATISIGVACCPLDGCKAAQLVDLAERRNARAKRLGKNQTVHTGEEGDPAPY